MIADRRILPGPRQGAEVAPQRPIALSTPAPIGHVATIGRDPSSFSHAAAILAVLALATALRVHGLVRQSAWADEITTLFIADPAHSFGRFWDLVLSDTHPPLFYLLMRWWSAAFGQSDLVARLPSLIFGVATVGAAAVAFKPYPFRGRLALMSLLAVSPGAIEYAQEARSYSLLLFLSTVITGACFRFIRCRGDDDRTAVPAIVILTIVGLIASYTHYFGFLIAVAAGLLAVAAARGDRRRLAAAAVGLATITTVFLPWVVFHARYMSYGVRMSAWIAEFPASATISWFTRLWLGGTPALIGCLAIASAVVSMPGFRAFARRETACWLGPSLALITIAAALAVSWHTPVLTSRNLIVVLPALYLTMSSLVCYGAARWGNLAIAVCFVAQLLLMTRALPWYYTADTKAQWRESAAFVLAQPGCAEGPMYVYGETQNYRYLVEKLRPSLKFVEVPVDRNAALARPRPAVDCKVLLWAAELSRSQFDAILSGLPADRFCVRVAAFYWAFVALRETGIMNGSDCFLSSRIPDSPG